MLVCPAVQAEAASKADFDRIDEGFRLFTKETFNGNGRTCATCHIPKASYTISPADIKRLRGKARKLVFATNVPGLENPKLVKKLALFNVEGGDTRDPSASPDGRHGPVFRGSMTVGPTDLTTTFNNGLFNPHGLPMLGWSGQGSPRNESATPQGTFPGPFADGSLKAFAQGAIFQHNTKSLKRIPGDDFRWATMDELTAMEAFQKWLGRRHEFELEHLTFKDKRVKRGKMLYVSDEASCNTCHVNGGSNFSPLPFPASSSVGAPNIFQHSDVDLERFRLSALTGVDIPEDEGFNALAFGFGGPPPPVPGPGAMNGQSAVESVFKKAFFHKHAFTSNIEDAITFYFREPFTTSEIHTALQGLLAGQNRPAHIDTKQDFLAFAGKNAFKEMGAFLRSLGAFYKIKDCERLVHETIERIKYRAKTHLPVMHCRFNLDDVRDVLSNAKVYPRPYKSVIFDAAFLKQELKFAAKFKDKRELKRIIGKLKKMRGKIATLTEVP